MIENTQDFYGESANKGDEDTSFARAYVEGKIGGLNVTAGRYNAFLANGNIYDDKVDGAEVSYGDKVKVTGFAGKATEVDGGNYAGGELAGAFGDLNLAAGYVNYKDLNKDDIGKGLDNAIWYVGADYTMGDVNLSGMYLKGDMSYNDVDEKVLDEDGWTVGLAYKGAEATEVGSWACSLTTMISVVKPTLHTPLMQTPLMATASKAMALALTIPSLKTSLVL